MLGVFALNINTQEFRTVLVILGRCGEAFPREELLLTIYWMVCLCLFDTQVSDDDYSYRNIQSPQNCDDKLWAAVGAEGSQSKIFLQLRLLGRSHYHL